jgi:uncharacterized protein YkwD
VTVERALRWLVVGLAAAVVLTLGTTRAAPTTHGRDVRAADAMHRLVDEARAQAGLAPLRPATDLADAAYDWSATMAATRVFEHNPDLGEQVCCWRAVAENIAWSDPPRVWRAGDPVAQVTAELHQALLDSPGHRANLLDPSADELGIGVHVDRDGSVWITQVFRHRVPG